MSDPTDLVHAWLHTLKSERGLTPNGRAGLDRRPPLIFPACRTR